MKGRSIPLTILALVAWAGLAVTAHAASRVYWSINPSGLPITSPIAFANLDGSGAGGNLTPGVTGNQPFGVAIDVGAGRIYWANRAANTISYANLEGSGGGGLSISGATVNHPIGLAIDPAAGSIYWGNEGDNTHPISWARLDGAGGGDLNITGATPANPSGVAIDPAAGRIYWANNASNSTPISWANLDGSGGGDLNTAGATASTPTGVAIDPVAHRIYWANLISRTISWANLDGSGGGTLNTAGALMSAPIGVAIDPAAGRLYWADNGFPNGFVTQISYAHLDGSGGAALSAGGAPAGATDHPEMLALLKAPGGTGSPAITGGSTLGSTLSCSRGSWTENLLSAFLYQAPRSYGYQWSRNGAQIASATSASLTATSAGDYTCQVTAANQAGSASQTSAAHTVEEPVPVLSAPVLSALKLAPRSFHPLARGPSVSRSRKRGTTVSYRLSAAASVKFTVQRVLNGRKVGKRCLAPTKKNRRKRHCRRYRKVSGAFTLSGRAGANRFRFSGRIGKRRLKPGRYSLIATPTANRLMGKPRKAAFKILAAASGK